MNRTKNNRLFVKTPLRYESELLPFFAAVGDIPDTAKIAYNTFVKTLKVNGLYSKLKYCLSFPPTLTASKALIDLPTATTIASVADTSVSPFNTKASTPFPASGFNISAATSYLKTGVIPSTFLTQYDHCTMECVNTPLAVSGNFDWGAFTGTSFLTANHYYTGSLQRTQRYNNTNGAGLFSFSGATGAAGVYWENTNASNFVELGYNSTQRGSGTTNGGTLPNIQLYLGTYNNNGSPGVVTPKKSSMFAIFSGLTTAQRLIAATAIATWNSDMKRTNLTKKIVLDGDSHTCLYNEKMFRTYQYNLLSKGNIDYANFGVSGQTTTQMISDEGTEISGAYNAGYTKNILIALEGTNEMYVGLKTRAQAITNMATYVSNAKSYGFIVCVKKQFCRQTPGTGIYPDATTWNLAVDGYNQDLDAGLTGADYILPCDATHFIPRSNYASDAAYNTAVAAILSANTYDGTHLHEVGYLAEANLDSLTLKQIL